MSSFNFELQVGMCWSIEPRVDVEKGVGQQNWQFNISTKWHIDCNKKPYFESSGNKRILLKTGLDKVQGHPNTWEPMCDSSLVSTII